MCSALRRCIKISFRSDFLQNLMNSWTKIEIRYKVSAIIYRKVIVCVRVDTLFCAKCVMEFLHSKTIRLVDKNVGVFSGEQVVLCTCYVCFCVFGAISVFFVDDFVHHSLRRIEKSSKVFKSGIAWFSKRKICSSELLFIVHPSKIGNSKANIQHHIISVKQFPKRS